MMSWSLANTSPTTCCLSNGQRPTAGRHLDPATCVFHYAFECFEGMKAYKDEKGNVRLFRPDRNMARLNRSSARIALPNFDQKAMIDLISQFVKTDERFIPA
jgi:branched-chain amino acid aminotransferase